MRAVRSFFPALLAAGVLSFAGSPAALAACADCGVVTSVQYVEKEGKGTGLGAVAGGVGGAVIGNQFGKGDGRAALTVAGAAGGAYAGHQVEKSVKTKKFWVVKVDMEGGAKKSFSYGSKPAFEKGDKVKVRNGKLALLAN